MTGSTDDLLLNPRDRALLDAIELVTNRAREACAGDCCTLSASLDACVDEAVTRLWRHPIKTYVSLLALRNVETCIRNGRCPVPEPES